MLLKFTPEYFGLDIGKRFWRLAALRKTGGKIVLTSFNEIKVPENVMKGEELVSPVEAKNLLKQLLNKTNGKRIKTVYAAVCLPEPETFIKLIEIPQGSVDKTAAIIEEAKKHIPYPLENTFLDFQIPEKTQAERVLIGVAPKNIVENFENVLINAGILPVALEIEAMSLARAVLPLNQELTAPMMIVDLGGSRSGLFAVDQNHIAFNLSLDCSGDAFTELIAKELKINEAAAEQLKLAHGLNDNPDNQLPAILQSSLDKLVQQITEALKFYETHFNPSGKIERLMLIGGASALIGLPEYLSRQINVKTEIGKADLNITQTKLKIPAEKLLSYGTAIGLALRQFQ